MADTSGRVSIDRRQALRAASAFGGLVASVGSVPAAAEAAAAGWGVDPARFGARYDGVSDDTNALQKAIDACAANGRWTDLIVSGPLAISKPIMIDRPVDRSSGIFRILGNGAGRLIQKGDHPIFDSRLPMQDHPVSEYVSLINLAVAGNKPLFSPKFLRIQIDGCFFDKCNLIETNRYVQSLEITRSRFVGGAQGGAIISARQAYDVRITNCNFERTGRIIRFDSANSVCICGCVMETCHTPIIDIDGVNGMVFNGNYTEGNGGSTIVLGSRMGKSLGISIFGNNLKGVQPSKKGEAEIVLGRSSGVASGGNFCAGNLYDTGYVALGELQSMADEAVGQLTSSDYPAALAPAGTVPAPLVIDLAKAVGSIPTATAAVTIVQNVRGNLRKILLPTSVSNRFVRHVTIVNEGPEALNVHVASATETLIDNRGGAVSIGPNQARTFLEYRSKHWSVVGA